MKKQTPANKQHFEILDIIRGIALLGVLFANTKDFSFFAALTFEEKANLPWAGLNDPLTFITHVFLDGKFYSLFSILFGIGFALFISKSNRLWMFNRRMFFLALFGIAHALLVWDGDILLLYALLGLSLPLLTRCKNRTLLFISVFLITSPLLMDAIRVTTNYAFDPGQSFLTTAIEKGVTPKGEEGGFRAYANLMKTEGYEQTFNTNEAGFYFRWSYLLQSNRPFKVLGLFIIGLLIGRNKLFLALDNKTEYLKRIRNWGFVIGLPSSVYMAYFEVYAQGSAHLLNTILYFLSAVPMALAYLAVICLCFSQNRYHRFLASFKPVGKMALSCYLMQSIVGILIYRGSGLGLALEVGPAIYLLIGLLLFAVQIMLCHLWLKHFEYGPFEWVWRTLTYWQRIPLRRLNLKQAENSHHTDTRTNH